MQTQIRGDQGSQGDVGTGTHVRANLDRSKITDFPTYVP